MTGVPRVVVIGAGIGGLTSAALLARRGLDVTVLEAHVYPGGCAGTFYHQGYRFDAGATLAGGFSPGGPMALVAQAAGFDDWGLTPGDVHPAEPAMQVHLPDGLTVTRYGGAERQAEHARAFGSAAQSFWDWQERTADALWALALRLPDWPPQSAAQAARLLAHGGAWLGQDLRRLSPALMADALRPLAARLPAQPLALRQFVDGQLLIAAQAPSATANALYGAAALDLPRRGVVHLAGGMGAIAQRLVQAVQAAGGRVLYRQPVTHIALANGHPGWVETRRGERFPADIVIANLPPWNLAALLGEQAPPRLQRLAPQPTAGWGAFMLYVGLDQQAVPPGGVLHHQVLSGSELGEARSAFISLSPAWDATRAPHGRRAVTISTHTAFAPWWQLYHHDRPAYDARRHEYAERLLALAEQALPGLRQAAHLTLPGTPVTFERFTRRAFGWVGGFPQTSLLTAWGPRLAPGLWLVGDSIFPGQSTAAVALGGLRVGYDILNNSALE